MPPEISVVIPCFNEEAVLDTSLTKIQDTCRSLKISYEIIVIDDGSQDRSWQIIESFTSRFTDIKGIRFSRNFGQQAALTAGLKKSCGEQILIIDADLQDPPELLGTMRVKLAEGYDVVYGTRRSRDGESFFKVQTAKMFYVFFNSLTDTPIPVNTGDFRLMTRRAVNAFLALPEACRFVRGMTSWIGFPQCSIAYDRKARDGGKTKYDFTKLCSLAMDAVASFSFRPLRIAAWISLVFLLCAVGLSIWVLIDRFTGGTQRGWGSLMIVIFGTSGIQTLLLGIIGEYLGRTFMEAKGRPLYIIRDEIENPNN